MHPTFCIPSHLYYYIERHITLHSITPSSSAGYPRDEEADMETPRKKTTVVTIHTSIDLRSMDSDSANTRSSSMELKNIFSTFGWAPSCVRFSHVRTHGGVPRRHPLTLKSDYWLTLFRLADGTDRNNDSRGTRETGALRHMVCTQTQLRPLQRIPPLPETLRRHSPSRAHIRDTRTRLLCRTEWKSAGCHTPCVTIRHMCVKMKTPLLHTCNILIVCKIALWSNFA